MAKKVIIGSDKSGFGLKEVVDDGTIDPENAMMYDAVARKVAPRVSSGEFEKGILICGTGMGMSIVANKFKGVSAAVCENTFAAEKARAINDANILTLGGWISAPEVGISIADTFLNTEFTQNLEDWRAENLKKAKVRVAELENENFK